MEDSTLISFMENLITLAKTVCPPMDEEKRFYIKITRIVTAGLLFVAFFVV